MLLKKGDLAAAEPLLREALAVHRETLGSRHPDTLISINNPSPQRCARGSDDGVLGEEWSDCRAIGDVSARM